MFIDFSPVRNNEMQMLEFSRRYTVRDLRAATRTYYKALYDLVRDMTDLEITYVPTDPHADDPHAVAGEESIGWSVAHLILHVTASLEEGATVSSILSRGIVTPREPRFRYEADWKTVTGRKQMVRRLRESRRMVLGYLDAWADEPRLDVYRDVSERFTEKFGLLNAPAAFLFSLMHLDGHLDQFREAKFQARAALTPAAAGD